VVGSHSVDGARQHEDLQGRTLQILQCEPSQKSGTPIPSGSADDERPECTSAPGLLAQSGAQATPRPEWLMICWREQMQERRPGDAAEVPLDDPPF
jgi:hypothetical protein